MNVFFIRWVPSIVWMAVIYYLSDQPGEKLGSFLPLVQKLFPGIQDFDWGHFAAYFILACTYYWGLQAYGNGFWIKAAVVVLCVLYGVSDEFHQQFVDGRHPDLKDLRNDTIGAILAMLFVSIPPVRRFIAKLAS